MTPTAAAAVAPPNTESVHAPTDIALCSLNTRNMFRNRAGRPRSEIRSAGEMTAPAAAIHLASWAVRLSPPIQADTMAMTEAAPATPPANR